MRNPMQLPAKARGLQALRPLVTPPKSVQQTQGLRILTVAAPATPKVVAATPRAVPAGNAFLRALAQIRDSLSHLLPASFAVAAAGFASGQATSVAACEPLGITQLENPADAVSAILEEATHSDQPLIFSAHSIETYLASRNSQGEKQGDAYGETGAGAPATEPVRRRRTKSAANLIQSVVKHYFIEPVASINNVVIETTQQTFNSIAVFAPAVVAPASASAEPLAPQKANWWKVGAKFAALVVAYDVAVLAVAYFAFFA